MDKTLGEDRKILLLHPWNNVSGVEWVMLPQNCCLTTNISLLRWKNKSSRARIALLYFHFPGEVFVLILQKWFSIVGAIFTLSEWGAYKVLILKKVPVQQHYRHTGNPQQLQKYKVAKTRDWKEETAAWMCSGTVSHSLSSLVPYTAKCRGKSKALIEQMVNILFYFLFSPVCSLRHCLLQTFQTRSE